FCDSPDGNWLLPGPWRNGRLRVPRCHWDVTESRKVLRRCLHLDEHSGRCELERLEQRAGCVEQFQIDLLVGGFDAVELDETALAAGAEEGEGLRADRGARQCAGGAQHCREGTLVRGVKQQSEGPDVVAVVRQGRG